MAMQIFFHMCTCILVYAHKLNPKSARRKIRMANFNPHQVSGLLCLAIGVFTLYRLPTLITASKSAPSSSSVPTSQNLLPNSSRSLPSLHNHNHYPLTTARSFLSLPPTMSCPPSSSSDVPDAFVPTRTAPPPAAQSSTATQSSASLLLLLSTPAVLLPLVGTIFGAVCQVSSRIVYIFKFKKLEKLADEYLIFYLKTYNLV